MDEHSQGESVTGDASRPPRTRVYFGIGAIMVALAVIAVAVAFTAGDDDGATPVATEPTKPTEPTANALDVAARLEACNKLLDLETNAPFPGPALVAALKELAAAATASGDRTLADNAAVYRDSDPTGNGFVSSEASVKAHDALIAQCRTNGVAGLNPVYVRASVGARPRVDLKAYGTEQNLEPVDQLPAQARAPRGRDLSAVQVATSNRGGYVMTWTYNQGPAKPLRCFDYGIERSGGGAVCRALDDRQSSPVEGLRFVTIQSPSSGGISDDAIAAIEVSELTAFVVFEAAGQRFVQQPAVGMTLFVWRPDGPSKALAITARAYDADGRSLGCVGSGAMTADQRIPLAPTTCT